jgi:hypothetical protein
VVVVAVCKRITLAAELYTDWFAGNLYAIRDKSDARKTFLVHSEPLLFFFFA